MRITLLILVLFGTGCNNALTAQTERGAEGGEISPETLEERYRALWDSVDSDVEVPPLVAHLGAFSGSEISVWAMMNEEAAPGSRNWGIECDGGADITVKEEVFDSTYGVALLTVRRGDVNAAPLPCTISVAGNAAEVVVPVLSTGHDANERFSFLALSCNEPYSPKHEGMYARDLSLWLRAAARARGEDSQGQIPERPQFALGLGDQVYVDPDPDADEPIAFFKGDRSNEWLIEHDGDALARALGVVYRYNFSLPPLVDALSRLPSMMMWDDHEIRDGWGSHCDDDPESPCEEGAEVWRNYFREARHAFIAHQLLRSYPPGTIGQAQYDSLVEGDRTLHRPFSHGERVHVLMLDSRSTRSRTTSIFDSTAQAATDAWLARGSAEAGDLYVLATGVPLFPSRRVRSVPSGLGFADDLRDSWDSPRNLEARKDLLGMIKEHFRARENANDRLLVLSGDVHHSAVYYISLGDDVIGHEVVTSGIAQALQKDARRVNILNDATRDVDSFSVTPAGKLDNVASFAELIVDESEYPQAPDVEVVFHANGATDGRWELGNTNLLPASTSSLPLWYYPYKYKYKDPQDHLEAIPEGVRPAGTIVSLDMSIPDLRTSFWSKVFFWRRPTILSATQNQAVFCTIPEGGYDSVRPQSWDLEELSDACVRRPN